MPTDAPEAPGATGAPGRGSSLGLGVAMAVSNLLAYGFVAVISRSLGPESFGAFSAVNNVGVLLAIPVGALQLVVARAQREGRRSDSGLGLGLALGAGLAVAGSLSAPVWDRLFRLDTPWVVIACMAALVPMMVTGALQGVLLGRSRLLLLGSTYLAVAALRMVAALAVGRWQLGLVGAFSVILGAAVLAALWAAWCCRDLLPPGRPRLERRLLPRLMHSNGTLAALMALASVDVLLARYYLPAEDSGFYALASTFGRIVFWGTQFLALTVVPALQPENSRRRVLEAGGMVVLAGLAAAAVAALVPGTLVQLLGGRDFADSQGLLLGFTVLGTLWGLAQVLLFADIAGGRGRLGWVAAAAVLVEVATIVLWEHAHAFRILRVALLAAGGLCAIGLTLALVRPTRAARHPVASAEDAVGVSPG